MKKASVCKFSFKKIAYNDLTGRQKEAFNFQKLSALLAEFGFITIPLSSDWADADFIAQHRDGHFIKIQLKSRLTFAKKYERKQLFICFPLDDRWYLYPHDDFLRQNRDCGAISNEFWKQHSAYSNGHPSEAQLNMLDKFQIRPGLAIDIHQMNG